jgi:hypothetical protein
MTIRDVGAHIDRIVFVDGPTRMPSVHALLEKQIGEIVTG